MEWDFTCNRRLTLYTNASASTQNIHVGVYEHCGGNQVAVIDAGGNVVNQLGFSSPGGAATLAIAPSEGIQVFCDGGSDPSGCKVEILF
jgi:hypothetical protein